MLSFLEQAIQSLSPKVTEFIKKYEPDALKKAEDIQAKEKKALQDEKDSQKYQEKNIAFGKTAPQQGYRPQYHPNDTYRGQPTRYQQPQYAENKPNSKKASNNEQKTASSSDIPPYPQQIPTNESKKPNNNNKESFLQATTDLTDFTKEFSDSEFKASLQTLEKLSTNYPEFTAPEGTDDDKKIEQLENFTRKLNKEIQSIFEELNALQNYAQKAQTSMSDSSEKDIEKLAHASSLSTINSRLNDYENEVERYHQTITVKNTANKGKLPAGEMQNHNDQLFQQALKLNGLAEKITQTQILFKSLDRTIKKELKRHKEAK
jgi:ElaB/YqjD/DUF883 family membrane-anchored ribosome-binding protein